MANKKVNISTGSRSEVDITPFGLKKSVNITIFKKTKINLYVPDFNIVKKYFLNIVFKSAMTAIASLKSRATALISGGKFVIALIPSENLRSRNTVISSVSNLGIFLRQTFRLTPNILSYFHCNCFLKQRMKITLALTNSKLNTFFTLRGHKYYSLGDHDPSTLGTLDVQTLGDLDFLVV